MSIELSPSQERRFHSILDRGLDTLQESIESISQATPTKTTLSGKLEGSYKEVPKKIKTPSHSDKSRIINSELKSLQEKLANLEAKLTKNPEMPPKSREKSPLLQRRTNESSPRATASSGKMRKSRERFKNIENAEKEITKLERSITPSPAQGRNNGKKLDRPRAMSTKGKRNDERVKKDLEITKKDLVKMEEMKNSYNKLQEEHNKLIIAFEKSEKIRKRQKDIIAQLKSELKGVNGENHGENNKKTQKNLKGMRN